MSAAAPLWIRELDEDFEVSGRRQVSVEDAVIPVARIPEHIASLEIEMPTKPRHVDEIRIGWLGPEEYPDFELTNPSRCYLEMKIETPGTTESEYNAAWESFRKEGIPLCLRKLQLQTWGLGKGIVDKRGHDLFVVELDGFDHPLWILFFSLLPRATFLDCLGRVEQVDRFVAEDLLPLIKR